MSGHITSDRFGNSESVRQEQLRRAEAELLEYNLGVYGSTTINKVDLLEGDKDYNFLFNFLPDTEVHRYDLNINYETNDVDKVVTQSAAKLSAAKEYYLEKAQELNDFWENVMPTREQYGNLVHLHHAKRYRLQRIVKLLNKEIAFNKEVAKTLETKTLTETQQKQMIESFKKMDEQRSLAQQNYLKDEISDFRIPFFSGDMPEADAKIQKEMFLIKDVILKDLNSNFYEAYNETIDQHIENQVKAKAADEAGNTELSKLYGYMSQFGLNLKNKFLDVFNDKKEHGTITEESLEESLIFFNNNYGAMQERLLPEMIAAIENGATFEELMETKTDKVSQGFSGLKDEFDSIYNGLIDHAEGKKTIADIMREKAVRTTDLHTNGVVTAYETAQNIISSRRATHVYDYNYDLDNDGDVDDTDIAALNDVLKSKNNQFDRYNTAYDKVDTDANGLISAAEAESMLTGYLDAVKSQDLTLDLSGDGRVNSKDLTVIKNIIKADLGIDIDLSGDSDTAVRNIISFVQDHAERRLEIWDMQDAKLEEYYDSAGESYGVRRQYYYRFLVTKYADSHQRMGGAYIDSMLTHVAQNRDWLDNHEDERNIEFNDRLASLNAALDKSLDIHQIASTQNGDTNTWYGSFNSWEENVEARVMSSLEIQTERSATYGLFYKNADDDTTAQVDKLFDLYEVTYADFYNNRYKWDISVNEGNTLTDAIEGNPDRERNIDASNVAMTTLRSVRELIYRSRHRAYELSPEQDNMYNEGLDAYIKDYVEFRDKIQDGTFTLESPQAEAFQDRMEAKFDLLMNLGNLEEGTTKAVAFADKDGDGIISESERASAHSDFDYAMRMEQILKTNDLGISEEGQEYLNQYDFNNDGLLNELDYDVLDNVVGISTSFPIHNIMNIINKQTKVLDFVDARIELEGDTTSQMTKISEFLQAEIAFDQNVKNDYWQTAFKSPDSFKVAYEKIEQLRTQIMDAIESNEDTSELISKLNAQKARVSQNQTYNPKVEATVGYLKFLDNLEDGAGTLVNKFLLDQDFFTDEVRDALEYINVSSIPAETLLNMLNEDPENFIEVVGYLKAAEKLELTDNFDQILSGGLDQKQINFLSAVGKFTESRDFLQNQDQNELFIGKLVDSFFGEGDFDSEKLSADYSDYVDLMVKYSSGFDSIDDDAQSLIDEMTATLFNSSTISQLAGTEGTRRNSFVSSRLSRRYLQRGTYETGSGNNNSENNFYGNIKKIFNSDALDSIEDLKSRDELLSQLNLAEEDSEANKLVAQQYLQAQIDSYNAEIEAKKAEVAALGNSRFNKFKIRNLNKAIKKLKSSVQIKGQLQSLFN